MRRIFALYADGHLARSIAVRLNEDGILPPGARWKKKTVRRATTWSYTAILGHRDRQPQGRPALREGHGHDYTMLEDAERGRASLQAGRQPWPQDTLDARLEKVLEALPERVQAYLEDLETLLAKEQIERGKDILASLGTEIVIHPEGTADIRGDFHKALAVVSGRHRESVVSWLAIIKDLRTALSKTPVPHDAIRELLAATSVSMGVPRLRGG